MGHMGEGLGRFLQTLTLDERGKFTNVSNTELSELFQGRKKKPLHTGTNY